MSHDNPFTIDVFGNTTLPSSLGHGVTAFETSNLTMIPSHRRQRQHADRSHRAATFQALPGAWFGATISLISGFSPAAGRSVPATMSPLFTLLPPLKRRRRA